MRALLPVLASAVGALLLGGCSPHDAAESGGAGGAGDAGDPLSGCEEPSAGSVVDYFDVFLGESLSFEIRVRNEHQVPLVVHGEELEPPFALAVPIAVIPPGAAAGVEIVFAPEVEGSFNQYLPLAVNGCAVNLIQLWGRGVARRFSCTPGKLDFGEVEVGARADGTIACTNLLQVDLAVAVEDLGGDDAAAFQAPEGSELRIAAGETVDIPFVFMPGSEGDAVAHTFISTEKQRGLIELEGRGVAGP